MKSLKMSLVMVLVLTAIFNCKAQLIKSVNYIKLESHGPIEEVYHRPLIISTCKLKVELTKQDITKLKSEYGVRVITPALEKMFLNQNIYFLITTKRTYLQMLKFIDDNPHFFTNEKNKNNSAAYNHDITSITAQGRIYEVFYKYNNGFFKNLIENLKVKNCDKKVITAIDQL